MLQAQPSQIQPPTMRRGHAHKRSAAISGDFDLDFFQRGPSINQTLAGSEYSEASSSLPTDSFLHKTYQSPSPPASATIPQAPALVITTPDEEDYRASRSIVPRTTERSSATTPSPKKKHTRLNSWAHSLIPKSKQKETLSASKLEYNSSSNDTTPELNRMSTQSNYSYTQTKPQNYEIPEAIIDLDLASGVHYDPASSVVPTKTKAIFHRRTESAPELEDFFKYKFSTQVSNKNSRRNSAIYEEEEDDEDEALSSTSSNAHTGMNKNRSVNSLNSVSSSNNGVGARVASPNTYQSMTSTPTSTKTRRGASAARYQSYYNNNILLANALKSSESLSQVTGGGSSLHRPSYSSFQTTQKSTLATPTSIPHSLSSSSASSLNSSVTNSPSRFKFESKVYDMPAGHHPGYAPQSPSTPKVKASSTVNTNTSPTKRSVTKSTKTHKKSNSLLTSLSMKIRGGSFSSTKSSSKLDISQERVEEAAVVEDDCDEDFEGDSTLTPFNFGEPGPALDLSTMTPKYYNDDYDQTTYNKTLLAQSSPSRVDTPKKSKKVAFLNWMKK